MWNPIRNHLRSVGAAFFKQSCVAFLAINLITVMSQERDENEYRNENYDYGVRTPREWQYETSKPPNPNHGFQFKPSPVTLVWVEAFFADDTSLSGAVATARKVWGKDCKGVSVEQTSLARLPASQIELNCTAGPGIANPTILDMRMALLRIPGKGIIEYEVGVLRPASGEGKEKAERAFRTVLDRFYLVSTH